VNDANDTSNTQNPSHIYENVYSYSVTLTVVNSFGCRDSVMKLLKVEDDFALFIPNAFTPSKADGKNDIFKVSGIGFLSDSFEMRIYDRWGELVFKTNDINKGWDGSIKGGKIANPDVFIYKITIKDFKNKTREYVGHITIL
jgi:gliding motility-associated-like protein